MSDGSKTWAESSFSFGPFRFIPGRQLLLENDVPVRLGSRAVVVLSALVERPGQLINKDELMARAWPSTTVEESNLKVTVAALRKALQDGKSGRRYVTTTPGRGYTFVETVALTEQEYTPEVPSARRRSNLPNALTRTIGREDTINTILLEIPKSRLITIVGSGGIGKTTVALDVARKLSESYDDNIWFVDLAPVQQSDFVPATLATSLGLSIAPGSSVEALGAKLSSTKTLIVLDSCEHVIDVVAPLAERIVSSAPNVHILATSREPLRIKAEFVHRLPPLRGPQQSAVLTARDALKFPAIQLFIERAAAGLEGFELSEADVPFVADICRKLEGIPLAIELAAKRIDAFGVRRLSALLDDRFRILSQGSHTALSRHRSLAAALDWSYEFLPESAQTLLRRISIFSGWFTIDAISAVAAFNGLADVIDDIDCLVSKSLLSTSLEANTIHYRLLDTTRAYAFQKLLDSNDYQVTAARHAEYFHSLAGQFEREHNSRLMEERLSAPRKSIDDIRSALNWAFSEHGNQTLGVNLTISATPIWAELSLMEECKAHVQKALSVSGTVGSLEEMKLKAALGTALMYTRGPAPDIESICTRALPLAEQLGQTEYQLKILWGLAAYYIYAGRHRQALALLHTFNATATIANDRVAQQGGARLTATATHYIGDQREAETSLRRLHDQATKSSRTGQPTRFQVDHLVAVSSTLAHVLWLRGYPDQALRMTAAALDNARAGEHVLSLCNTLALAACPIALYVGDLDSAKRLVQSLEMNISKSGLTIWKPLCQCLQGTLLLQRKDASGIELLEHGVAGLQEEGFGMRSPAYLAGLALAFSSMGRTDDATGTLQRAFSLANSNDENWYVPELLRIQGALTLMEGTIGAEAKAESSFRSALDLAHSQGALSWELRAASSLADLWHGQGQQSQPEVLLAEVYSRFTEGYDTADLERARLLLDKLRTEPRRQGLNHGSFRQGL